MSLLPPIVYVAVYLSSYAFGSSCRLFDCMISLASATMKRPACKNDNPASKRKDDGAVQPVQHGSKTRAIRAAEPASILDEDWH